VQPAEHLGFGVRLADVDLETERCTRVLTEFHQFRVRGRAVDHRLAGAQAPQVRTIEDIHLLHTVTPMLPLRRFLYVASSTAQSRAPLAPTSMIAIFVS
jgi:hypothetical protein